MLKIAEARDQEKDTAQPNPGGLISEVAMKELLGSYCSCKVIGLCV